MRGRKLNIQWQHNEATLKELYLNERCLWRKTRFHALWLIRRGRSVVETADLLGIPRRNIQRWLQWYRQEGIEAVRQRQRGGGKGRTPYVTPAQRAKLEEKAQEEGFRTIGEAVHWVQAQWGVLYTYNGMRSLFRRLKFRKKTPRPMALHASSQQQEAWKKGDFWRPSELTA